YDLLIRPVRAQLGAGERLVFVTDGTFAAVPFAALRDGIAGRALVADHAIRFAGSLRDAATDPARRRRRGAVLLVGDPAFASAAHPLLRRLPGAAAEVGALGRAYAGATVLTGRAATVARVRARLSGARVLHYAGHAVFDAGRPERSYLVLAHDERRTGGDWRADAIADLRLPATDLVVLAACQTLGSRPAVLDGVAGVAGAFRAAGAAGVLAAAWRVDDAATRPFMLAFHRAYGATGDGPGALRAAQLTMMRDPRAELRSPAAWGSFHFVGH
ncbi:MAG TPA: CHAT domain-containing protein, partial [Gemmatirosa sp.]